jgi:UDP-N-acetylglucosamine--N-acetylmuramyl-(pentapeptide) pyrophosphoryl-undecaprenol N-acetylglucosamine transferase
MSQIPSSRTVATRKMLLVASTGGHLAQLVRFSSVLGASEDSLWITFRTPQSESLLRGKRVRYVPYVRSRDWWGALRTAGVVMKALQRERFALAVSTGAAIAVSALPLAKLRGISLSGRLIAASRTAELRTQHPGWATARWKTIPSVFATYRSVERPIVPRPALFVTLGTIEGYRFDSLIDQVLASGLADERTVWQLGFTTRVDSLPGRVFQQVSAADFDRFSRDADVVITHAGVGSLLGLLETGIYPVLVTRKKSRGEHVDDHQLQIASLARSLDIAAVVDAPDLDAATIIGASRHQIANPHVSEDAQ